jgi:hypothetical protein
MSQKHYKGHFEHAIYPTDPKTQPQLGGTGKKPPVKYTATTAPKPEGERKNLINEIKKYLEKPRGVTESDIKRLEKWLYDAEKAREQRLKQFEKQFYAWEKKRKGYL